MKDSGVPGLGIGLPFTIADNDALYVEFKVPIQGWNANFNPLLSLPLVKIGSDVETWGRNNFGGYASSYAPYLTGTDQNFDNTGNIISVVNTSTEGIKITALVDCFLNSNIPLYNIIKTTARTRSFLNFDILPTDECK